MALGGSKIKCTRENIFVYLDEKRKAWKISAWLIGTDVCSQYQVLIKGGIPTMACDDVSLVTKMLSSVAKEIRSKHRAEHLPPKMPTAQREPVIPSTLEELVPPTPKKG